MTAFARVPADAFKKLQLGAGILLSEFNPAAGTIPDGSQLGATSGGLTFEAVPEFSDFGEDIDNCSKNMLELKRLGQYEAKLSGSLVTCDTARAKSLIGAADSTTSNGVDKITPRGTLDAADFDDIWWIGDYSDVNTGASCGFIAIHLMNALSTGGFKLTSADKEKGKFDFEYTAHYSMAAQDTVPFEIYIRAGEAEEPTYVTATLTSAGFKYGVTYYTRSGSGTEQSPYVYTEVTAGTAYQSDTTYYVRSTGGES